MFCPKCGAALPSGSAFCPKCGHPIVTRPSTANTEKILLERSGTVVTSTRFILPEQTYPIAGITSVGFERIGPSYSGPITTAALGGVLLLFAEARVIGIEFLVVAILWFAALQSEYAVKIRSASGEFQVVKSKNLEYIKAIINALNEAIARRG